MTPEQIKRRDELAYSYEAPTHRNCYGCCQSDSDYENAFKAGYDAGFADAKEEILKLKTALGVAGEFIKRNDELTRKLEVAKKALIQSKTRLEYLETVKCHFSSGKSKCNIENGMSLSSVKEALKELE